MAILGDLSFYTKLSSCPTHPLRPNLAPLKVGFSGFLTGGTKILEIVPKRPCNELEGRNRRHHQCLGIASDKLSARTINQAAEGFLLDAVNMSFLDRLNLAWKILFPSTKARRSSNANIAKQRLKMILFSDRCAVSDEAKQKIVSNIVGVLSDFVEIDSQDKVQLSVSTDPDLGTVYSVTVPVKRVKAGYQDYDEDYRGITSIEYKDKGEQSGSVDVRFDFFVPNENA
ncbi:cell division topological specificity factor homolog, chloroplastic-like [Tasmannia lanceolata]|uniref:cell division topological specificity factor homolog, chloroplastic-like n=1 Tax=Tasmannia lanceolata TaxID=3420 RepID=UPI0040629BAC